MSDNESSDRSSANRVFIGGIGRTQKEEIEREFGRFGKLTKVWVAQNPPGFAFVEYDHISEADLAVAEMNGQSLLGSANKIRVEHSHGDSRPRGRGPPRDQNRGYGGMSRGPPRDRYGGGGGGGGGYDNGGGYRNRSYNNSNYGGGGGGGGQRYSDGGDRRRQFGGASNGRQSGGGGGGGGGRYRSDSGSDRYGGGGGGGGGAPRYRSRSPPSGGRSGKYSRMDSAGHSPNGSGYQ